MISRLKHFFHVFDDRFEDLNPIVGVRLFIEISAPGSL